jgi:hypothetical protein
MKRILALAFLAAALSVPAAQAATPKGPTLKQFNALKAQLAKDEKAIKTLQTNMVITIEYQVCETAATADALQSTWQSIDALMASLGKPTVFGPQTPINDVKTCSDLNITRSQAVPANTSVFSSLTSLLG